MLIKKGTFECGQVSHGDIWHVLLSAQDLQCFHGFIWWNNNMKEQGNRNREVGNEDEM